MGGWGRRVIGVVLRRADALAGGYSRGALAAGAKRPADEGPAGPSILRILLFNSRKYFLAY